MRRQPPGTRSWGTATRPPSVNLSFMANAVMTTDDVVKAMQA
jgi:hypothetical protein